LTLRSSYARSRLAAVLAVRLPMSATSAFWGASGGVGFASVFALTRGRGLKAGRIPSSQRASRCSTLRRCGGGGCRKGFEQGSR